MSAEYCKECEGDPRRRENVERHQAHTERASAPSPPALPGNLKEEWYDT
jgi:hypothetical protein